MAPVTVRAILQCGACLECFPVEGRVAMLPKPIPGVPGAMFLEPNVALDREQIESWSVAHYGPVILAHYHLVDATPDP